MSRMISFFVLVAILVALGVIFFRLMSAFLVPIFFAALLGVIFHPIHMRVLGRVGANRRHVAATVSVILVMFVVLAPAALILSRATIEGLALIDRLRDVSVRDRLASLRKKLSLDIYHHDDLRKIQAVLTRLDHLRDAGETPQIDERTYDNLIERCDILKAELSDGDRENEGTNIDQLHDAISILKGSEVGSVAFDNALDDAIREFSRFRLNYLGGPFQAWLKELVNPSDEEVEQIRDSILTTSRSPLFSIGGSTVASVVRLIFGICVMVTSLFFIFADGEYLLDTVLSFSPLEAHYVRELLAEFDRASRAVVVATLLAALVQGALAGIGFHVAGVGSVFLLMLLTALLALVPFLGAASVWVPASLWLYFYQGREEAGLLLALYGFFIVSLSDNLIKPLVLHGQSNLHPLLALLSVLGGVQALGPVGILVGPMSVVFLQTLVRILHREYKAFESRIEDTPTPSENDAQDIVEREDLRGLGESEPANGE